MDFYEFTKAFEHIAFKLKGILKNENIFETVNDLADNLINEI